MRLCLCIPPAFAALVACAHPAPPPLLDGSIGPTLHVAIGRPAHSPQAQRATVVASARSLLAGEPLTARGLNFPEDPVGFVRAAFWTAEVDLFESSVAADKEASGMEILFRSTAVRGKQHTLTPRPGDLVFFDAEPLAKAPYPAQVAIVEEVRGTGTITAIGVFANGPRLVTLNLRMPDAISDAQGERINDRLDHQQVPLARVFRVFADPFAG